MKKILFICTGNFYRSRYCEAYMDYLGKLLKLPIYTYSKGFEIELADKVSELYGEVSPYTLERLKMNSISYDQINKDRERVTQSCIDGADIVVIIDKNEHSVYMNDFDFSKKNLIHWEVKDIADWPPNQTLESLENNCQTLSFDLWNEHYGY